MNGEAAVNEYDDKVIQADDMIRQLMDALIEKVISKTVLWSSPLIMGRSGRAWCIRTRGLAL
jgi:hypothetical protein